MFSIAYRRILYALAGLLCLSTNAQDTLRLTLPQAEGLFLSNNYLLLVEQYNIDVAQAGIIQAKLYNNPTLALSGSVYNPEQRKVLDISNRTGQHTVDVQQLVLLAGKRRKQIHLAETGAQLAGERFMDLVRTLRYALRSNFYQLYFLQRSYSAYGAQISALQKLNATYRDLQARGVVTLKDAVRIRSLLYTLQSEQTLLLNQIAETMAELQLLLQQNGSYVVAVSDGETGAAQMQNLSLRQLLDTAYANRFDLRIAKTNILYAEQNHTLQRALAVPDLTIGGSYDKRGAHVENATFLNLAIDLPFFNRNQGGIRAARAGIAQSKTLLQLQQSQVENEVQKAYGKALNAEQMLNGIDPRFREDFDRLLVSITENFGKRNINLLEFVDFYESYKDNLLQLNELQNQRAQAIEELHLAIGKTIVNN